MSVKVEVVLNDHVVEILLGYSDPNQRAAAVRDVLLSSANELVAQIAQEGLKQGAIITKRVGVTLDGEVADKSKEARNSPSSGDGEIQDGTGCDREDNQKT